MHIIFSAEQLTAFTNWQRAGNCERPLTGECSAEGTCCGLPNGKMDLARECKMEGMCPPDSLKKTINCSLRCHIGKLIINKYISFLYNFVIVYLSNLGIACFVFP